MKQSLAAPHGTVQRYRLDEIAGNDLTVDPGQIAPVAVGADKRADTVSGVYQGTQHGRADKPCRAGQ